MKPKGFKKFTAWLLTLAILMTFIPNFVLIASANTGAFDGEPVVFSSNYTITVSDTEGGSITADKATASEGETVTLTITPDEGYVINTVKYNDTEITEDGGVYSFIMPAEEVTVSVTFIDVVRNFLVKRYDLSDKYGLSRRYQEGYFTSFEHNFAEGKFELSKEELAAAANIPGGYEITDWKICPARRYDSTVDTVYELVSEGIKAYGYQSELSFEDASDYKYYALIPIAERKNYINTHPTEEKPSVSVTTNIDKGEIGYKWFRSRAMKETISPESERVIAYIPDALETYKDGKWYLKDDYLERGAVVLNRIRLNKGETINITVYGDHKASLASLSICRVSDQTLYGELIEAIDNTFTFTATEDIEFTAYIVYMFSASEEEPSFTENDYIVYDVIDLSQAEEISGERNKTLSSEAITAGYSYFAEVDFNGTSTQKSKTFGVDFKITHQPTSSKPYIKTNGDEDISEYVWYQVGKEAREHTEVIAPDSERYEDWGMPFPVCDEDGWWSVNGNGYNIAAVKTDFKAGERITVETSGEAEVASIGIYNNQETQEVLFALEKISETEWTGEFTEDIPDGIVLVTYTENMIPNEDKHRVSVTIEIIDDILVEGETGSKLSKGVDGEEYYAVIRFGDLATLISDSFEWKTRRPSSSSSTSTTTTKNEDGSKTVVTENKATGTKTEVTTNTDGSTTTVETKKDGTVTTTAKDKDGNTTTTVEKPDGTTVITEKDTDGTKTVTTKNADGSTTTEETKKDGTTVKTETNADGKTTAEVKAKGETEIVIPVENTEAVYEVVVTDEDGNKTVITDFETVDGGIAITVDGNAIVSVSKGSKKEFVDVHPVNHWATADVDYTYIKGLMKGTSETHFSPDVTLTRAMLVTVLYRLEGEPETNKSIPFNDVDMSAYYANAVIWAKQNGIVNGMTENEFSPDTNITREQIATIMFRYAQYKGMDAVTLEEILHFADADEISGYAVSAMNWAVGSGLMKGKSATTINPLDNATRAEVAAILHRFIESNK